MEESFLRAWKGLGTRLVDDIMCNPIDGLLRCPGLWDAHKKLGILGTVGTGGCKTAFNLRSVLRIFYLSRPEALVRNSKETREQGPRLCQTDYRMLGSIWLLPKMSGWKAQVSIANIRRCADVNP